MKNISETEDIKLPSNVKVNIKGRVIEVEGPRGKLQRDLHHVNVDLKLLKTKKGDIIHIVVWHGNRKQVACLRTIKSSIQNLIKGVTQVRSLRLIGAGALYSQPRSYERQGFLYKMRLVYAHFPINCIITDGKSVEIRNFLGEKVPLCSSPAPDFVADTHRPSCRLYGE